MFDINGAEFIVLAIIVLVVVGPERLPTYAAQLGRMVRELRKLAAGAREQVRAELGPEFDDVDWAKLDPRQYDPRRIVREALTEAWEDDDTPTKPVTNLMKKATPEGVSGPGAREATAQAAALSASAGFASIESGSGRRDESLSGRAPFDPEAT